MDGHAPSARDEAEDVVARQGVAALGVADEHVVDPVDPDRPLVALDDLAHEPREAPLAQRLRRPALPALLVGRGHDGDHVLGVDLPVADRHEHLLEVLHLQLLEDALHLGVALQELRRADPHLAELALEELLAEALALVALLGAKVRADLGPRARRADEVEPVLVRMLVRARQHLDDVPVPQLVPEGLHLAVDLRAGDAIPELRVDLVGEVHGRRAPREDADIALRREDVDLVLEEVDLHPFEELGRVRQLLLPLEKLPQPREALRILLRDSAPALLVLPVRRDAALGDPVHLVGADLDLDPLATRADDRRVERLVHVHGFPGSAM